jgi:hypothetical protein
MEDKKKLDNKKFDSRENKKNKKELRRYVSKRESIFLSVSDILTLVTILLDVSYLGNITEINRGSLWAINGVMLILSYFAYQLKRRIRKRMLRDVNK